MPKPVSSILDPERRAKKRKKRKKRKVDYTELLKTPVVPDVQCPHTKKIQDKSQCSTCMGVAPSVVHRPPPIDWWSETAIEELDIHIDIDLILPDTGE